MPRIHRLAYATMVSARDNCKRALVTLLKVLGVLYGCCVEVTRDSTDADARKAYRTASRKVHPDRGGDDRATTTTASELARLGGRIFNAGLAPP